MKFEDFERALAMAVGELLGVLVCHLWDFSFGLFFVLGGFMVVAYRLWKLR